MMEKNGKIFVAGHRGMVGSAIKRFLEKSGFSNLVTKTRSELDLTSQGDVQEFFEKEKPEYVFLAAAKVGGINANNVYRGEFLYDNLQIQNNVIHQSYLNQVKKLLFLGSSCIYPRDCPQPIKEEYLLTGKLEQTNEPYAIAKIAGIKLCENYNRQYGTRFISAMPTNLYGVNDNFHLENSHVLPALIKKIHAAKNQGEASVEIWGTGTPKREFLNVDELAEASVFLMENYEGNELVNIGTGSDVTIKELAELICSIVGYEGSLSFNTDKPDGTMRKLMDVSKINNLGWKSKLSLEDGIRETYAWFCQQGENDLRNV